MHGISRFVDSIEVQGTMASENKDLDKFMTRAVELSKEGSTQGLGTPFGAVIVRDGAIIAGSPNLSFVEMDPTAHAEVSAIRQACKALRSRDLSGYDLFTSCYPCPMCMAAIYWAKVSRVYYATPKSGLPSGLDPEESTMLAELNKPDEEKAIPVTCLPIFAQAAQTICKEWQNKHQAT